MTWASKPTITGKSPEVRVAASTTLTNRGGATPTFVGIGLDENIPTRMLNSPKLWRGIQALKAREVFGARSRNADLVWRTPPATGAAPANWEPISGHTPAVKSQPSAGNNDAIHQGHGNGRASSGRDGSRERAIKTTLDDAQAPHSPDRFGDTAIMASLATIKHMSSPSTELALAKQSVASLAAPRYAALTGNADLRAPAVFDSLVAHVQEERERKKWETGSVLLGIQRLNPLVPPVMRSYLETHGNDPHAAREKFRGDSHGFWLFRPNVNQSESSDTGNLEKRSLHQLATISTNTGRRKRALSDARWLPAVAPANSRGH